MRYIDPKKTEGNELDKANHENAPVDESRRRFIVGGFAALFATALISACDDTEEPEEEIADTEPVLSPENEIASKNDIGQIRSMLIAKYPELAKLDDEGKVKATYFRKLALVDEADYESDPLVQAYFLKVSYEDILHDGLMRKGDDILEQDYLHPGSEMWPRKLELMDEGQKNKKGEWVVKPNKMKIPATKRAAENVKPYGDHKIDYREFDAITNRAVERVVGNMPEKDSLIQINDFTSGIDADLLMSIAIHEIMPKKMDGKSMNSAGRVALLRTLFEKGFEINKIPAVGDSAFSFGAVQMTDLPYEGGKSGQGDFGAHKERFDIPEHLEDCVDLEDQMVAALLLQFINFNRLYKKMLEENEKFMGLWKASSLVERRTFMATLLAAAHNYPYKARLALDQAIGWKRILKDSAEYFVDDKQSTKEEITSLMDLREGFVNILKRVDKVAADHARQSSDLVNFFSRYNMDSHPAAEIENAPVVETGDIGGTPKPMLETRTITMTPKGPEGNKHYVYTMPNWKFEKVLELLCGSADAALVERIKKHNNNTEKFVAGDVIWIPTAELKPEFRKEKIIEYKIPKNYTQGTEAFVRSILKDGYDPDIAILYNSKATILSDLSDLEGIVRLPASIVKE